MKFIKPWKRHIAPRLASGRSRENWGGRLPEDVKYAIYLIATRDKKSVSWVMEELVIKSFGLKTPEYLKPKPKPAEVAADAARAQEVAESTARDKHRKDDEKLKTAAGFH